MANKHNSLCIIKAADDEPLFVLRAQDFTSPQLILEWIKVNFETCPNDKLNHAFQTAMEMKEWGHRKQPD